MARANAVLGCWYRSLANLCEISHDDIKRIVCELSQTSKKAIGKGYQFFPGLVHPQFGRYVLTFAVTLYS